VPKKVPQGSHKGSHITRKKGVYSYRRRLPGAARSEVCLSLRTRRFREAEHRAALLDEAFDDALRRARANVTDTADLNSILRKYLRECLDADVRRRVERQSGRPIYAYWWEPGGPETATEADLREIRAERSSLRYVLDHNSWQPDLEDHARSILAEHGLPDQLLGRLVYGMTEANIHCWDVAERRTLGTEPVVFNLEGGPSPPQPTAGYHAKETKPAGPLASNLLEPFGEWGRKSGGWRAGAESQAKVSVTLFIEVCGDKPIDAYSRADGESFRTILRKLPTTYRKSAKDRNKPLPEIIAEAEAANAPRISEKTLKRHFWALSRFFAFLVETGRLPREAENPGRGFTFNTKGSARKGRDMWTGEELQRLFASPVWMGCHPRFRARPGPEVIRDALFWLPLLGLFHGNRLEEFAQLRREDVGYVEGIPYLRITDEDGRQLKNEQSRRDVPLHPELIRIGFLDYVAQATSRPQDQVFPELKPGGKDQKLGYYFSKQFSAYREAIGVRRRGLDYHSFRHGVTTKLYQANVSEAWIDLLTGHDQDGGESRRRYLKGIPLPQLRVAIEGVTWPEVDLSRLYILQAGDERWPATATKTAA
jgi:hypothetical protein